MEGVMMRIRTLLRSLLVLGLLLNGVGVAVAQKVHVRGYTKKDGTVVRPPDRAAPGSGGASVVASGHSLGPGGGATPRLPYSPRSAPAPHRLELRPIPAPAPYRAPRVIAPHAFAGKRSSAAPGALRDSRGRIQRSAEAKQLFEYQTGHPHGWPGHVVDHIVPLACGGVDAPSNMQWQTTAAGKAKDRTERIGCSSASRRP